MNHHCSVRLDSLDPQQLTSVKKQLDEEVEHLSSSFTQLVAAQSKFKECLSCVQTQEKTATTGKSNQAQPDSCSLLLRPSPVPFLQVSLSISLLTLSQGRSRS